MFGAVTRPNEQDLPQNPCCLKCSLRNQLRSTQQFTRPPSHRAAQRRCLLCWAAAASEGARHRRGWLRQPGRALKPLYKKLASSAGGISASSYLISSIFDPRRGDWRCLGGLVQRLCNAAGTDLWCGSNGVRWVVSAVFASGQGTR